MIANNIEDLINDDIFYRLQNFTTTENTFIKLEQFNPSGSIKIKPALSIVDNLERQGKIIPGVSRIITSSSGNLGVALSIVCCVRNYHFTCVVDPNVNELSVRTIETFGGSIDRVTQLDHAGGYLNTRLNRIKHLLNCDKNHVFADQYFDPVALESHYLTTAPSIFAEFAQVDYLFVGCGTVGTLMGCVKYVKEQGLKTKIIAVDAKGSVSFGTPPGCRYVPGLGSSMVPPLLDKSLVDEFISVPEQEGINMCHHLAREYGLCLGGSSGMVLSAIQRFSRQFKRHDVCVGIMPDGGGNYLNTMYNPTWLQEKGFEIPVADAMINNNLNEKEAAFA